MNFRLWMESKFLRLPTETKQAIDALVTNILQGKKTSGIMGSIVISGRKIPVISKNLPSDIIAQYASPPEIIFINDEIFINGTSRNALKDAISHEAIHPLDPKMNLPHKTTIPGSPEYYNSRIEFDAYGSQIEMALKRKFYNKQTPIQSRLKELNDLKNSLRTGKGRDTDKPPFSIWKTNPYLWKKFRQKLFTTITDIEQDLNNEQNNG